METVIIRDKRLAVNEYTKDEYEIHQADISDEFKQAVAAIQQGQIVAFPTETVYGLGANALDPQAVKKIFEAKGRPSDNPLIVHVSRKEQIYPLIKNITPLAQKLIDTFMPGPITLVFSKSELIPYEVTAGLETVAIRIPSHSIARIFLEMAGLPIAAPSANVSGKPSPTTADHVYDDLNGKIPFIIDGGPCRVGVESTVVDVTGDIPVILRPGAITAKQIRQISGDVTGIGSNIFSDNSYETAINQNTPDTPMSPGMKYRHYAPKATILLADAPLLADRIKITKKLVQKTINDGLKAGVYGNEKIIAAVEDNKYPGNLIHTFSYGSECDIKNASAKLFRALREMDAEGVDIVIAEAFPIKDIGVAYMNRLLKAAGIFTNAKRSIGEDKKDKVLFVCFGNTCRSPMAEAYFNVVAAKANSAFYANSAGLQTIDKLSATKEAIMTMKDEYGIDLSCHRSKKITEDQIAESKIVLAMTNCQKMMLKDIFSQYSDKIFTIGEYASILTKNDEKIEICDIPDPFGSDSYMYQETAKSVIEYIDIIIKFL